jgi:lactoylglutathione lyase
MAATPPDGSWVMQQTMLRVKEPKRSLDFYTKVLGMTLIEHVDFPKYKFSLYFVGYLPAGMTEADLPPVGARHVFASRLPGLIELTHNHGTEAESGPVYHVGNSSGGCDGGFGHIGVTVPDVYAACERFKTLGAAFKKSPNSGGMKGLAFILDPDGYAIEVVHQGPSPATQASDCCGFTLDGSGPPGELFAGTPSDGVGGGHASVDAGSYYAAAAPAETAKFVMQQTMIRIKEPARSLAFYTRVMGMTLVKQLNFPQWKFSLYFMGYLPAGMTEADLPPVDSPERMTFLWGLPATVELTHNHGSETKAADPVYHPGNNVDGVNGGFGHIGVTVPDVYAACEWFKAEGVTFKKSPNSGGMKGLAFIKDPDGYWIEIMHQGEPRASKPEVDCMGVHIDGGGGYTGGGGSKN